MMVFAIFIIMLFSFCVHARDVFKFIFSLLYNCKSHTNSYRLKRCRTNHPLDPGHNHSEIVLTLIDKVCNVLDFHQCWGRALFVQDEESLQKVFPTNGASPLLPAEADSALRMINE